MTGGGITGPNGSVDKDNDYSYYRSQLCLATREELEKELAYLRSFQGDEIFEPLIGQKLRDKVQLVLESIADYDRLEAIRQAKIEEARNSSH